MSDVLSSGLAGLRAGVFDILRSFIKSGRGFVSGKAYSVELYMDDFRLVYPDATDFEIAKLWEIFVQCVKCLCSREGAGFYSYHSADGDGGMESQYVFESKYPEGLDDSVVRVCFRGNEAGDIFDSLYIVARQSILDV